ncbi:uncharacterized protein LOC115373277 isoform X2 [Myripristis murdjan]|uniref:uncharacterized protein LOC115373277 isoform X2 n=1 Tax=Myripristis murdjan TaxID=586833 RepID=UPI0011761E87|nr:uncharacterized protein LOC115373277 isoform X2 [Myripristis murdjan]
MPPGTIKGAVQDALEDLTKSQLDKFRSALLDRGGKTRVRRGSVDGKDFMDITDALVSTFTEPGALRVTKKLLKLIGCNKEAQDLDLQTRSLLDKSSCPPCKNGSPRGKQSKPSQEAASRVGSLRPRRGKATGPRVGAEKPEEAAVTHPLVAHPALKRDARSHQESDEAEVRALQPGQQLISFSKCQTNTVHSLYESEDEGEISFMSYRQRMIANQATKRDDAINYMWNRDQEENTAAADGAAADEGAAAADAAATSPDAMQLARNEYQPPKWKKSIWWILAACLGIEG